MGGEGEDEAGRGREKGVSNKAGVWGEGGVGRGRPTEAGGTSLSRTDNVFI